jgi:hypothetical protein
MPAARWRRWIADMDRGAGKRCFVTKHLLGPSSSSSASTQKLQWSRSASARCPKPNSPDQIAGAGGLPLAEPEFLAGRGFVWRGHLSPARRKIGHLPPAAAARLPADDLSLRPGGLANDLQFVTDLIFGLVT